MLLKQTNRTATLAWCPVPGQALIAAASLGGSFDVDFSSSAKLEIFSVDCADRRPELPVWASTESPDRLNRLDWSLFPGKELGLIAGGSVDGTIFVWDAAGLSSAVEPLALRQHTSEIKGLQFNPLQSGLLASSSADGQLYIWNLAGGIDSAQPYTPAPRNPHTDEISDLAWNRKVPHILASTSNNGLSVIWDLKAKRPAFTFQDKNRKLRCSSIAWNPDVATQVAVSSDDDSYPAIQIWDLRTAVAPVRVLEGHHNGVLSLSWNPFDANLLLSCGKDNSVLCWNPETGAVLAEFASFSNWIQQVQWSPRQPSLYSVASFDGTIGIHSFLGSEAPAAEAGPAASAAPASRVAPGSVRQAPKWLRRPCGASFGFAGRLACFGGDVAGRASKATPAAPASATVQIRQIVSDAQLLAKADALDHCLLTRNFAQFAEEREAVASQDGDRDAAEIWKLLSLLLTATREDLVEYFGYSKDRVTQDLHESLQKLSVPSSEEDLFCTVSDRPDGMQFPPEAGSGATAIPGLQSVIRRALMVGDFESAVQGCFASKQFDVALLVASCGGQELWERTRQRFMEEQLALRGDSVSATILAVVKGSLRSYIESVDVSEVRDALVLVCSYAKDDEFPFLCNLLGDRLEHHNLHMATVCYMCARNLEQCVRLWMRRFSSAWPSSGLVDVTELTCIFRSAIAVGQSSTLLADVLTAFADRVVAQGRLDQALRFLSMVEPTDRPSAGFDELLERIRISHSSSGSEAAAAPAAVFGVGSTAAAGAWAPPADSHPSLEDRYVPAEATLHPYGTAVSAPPVLEEPLSHMQSAQGPTPAYAQQQQQQQQQQQHPFPATAAPPATVFYKPGPSAAGAATVEATALPPSRAPAAASVRKLADFDIAVMDQYGQYIAFVLRDRFNHLFGGAATSAETKMRDGVEHGLSSLFELLENLSLPQEILQELATLGQSMQAADFATADGIASKLTKQYWGVPPYQKWLKVLKQLVVRR